MEFGTVIFAGRNSKYPHSGIIAGLSQQ